MTWVKVCGLSRPDDVRAAEAAGADAVGLVLVTASPRRITIDTATRLAAAATVTTVILTEDLAPADLLAVVEKVGATGVQPYGAGAAAAAAAAAAAGLLVLWPVPAFEVAAGLDVPAGAVPLVDHRSEGRLGGTGMSFDWTEVAGIERDFVLAGGLSPANVAEAVRLVRPWGVDASTGLESAHGVKDAERIIAFVEEAKRA